MISEIAEILHLFIPLFLAALGAYLPYRTGLLNLAMDGLISFSAFLFFTVSMTTGNLLLAVVVTVSIAMLLSYFHVFLHVRFGGDIYILGLGYNLFFYGLISVLSEIIWSTKGTIRWMEAGGGYFPIFAVACFVLFGFLFFFLSGTKYGIRLRAVGHNEKIASLHKINVAGYKTFAFCFSGLISALVGIFLLFDVSSWVPNISAGKGWIGLIIIFLAGTKSAMLAVFTLVFVLLSHAMILLQGMFGISSYVIGAVPYIVTILILIIFSSIKRRRRLIR